MRVLNGEREREEKRGVGVKSMHVTRSYFLHMS